MKKPTIRPVCLQSEVFELVNRQSKRVIAGFAGDTRKAKARAREIFLYAALRGIDLLDGRVKKDVGLTSAERDILVAVLEKHRALIALLEDAHVSEAEIAAAILATHPRTPAGARRL